ncbi:MAG: PadR family transcriptional regulator [Ktedonobacteraceae bacterium]|nr:PadR family transcriptional regulator [Ktedonobacteraceae bacterium]
MYELIVLSLLMHWPLHGYLIAKISNDIIGPWEKISKGTMYSLLAKLERGGLVKLTDAPSTHQTSDRQSKAYEITQAGHKRFFELMLDTTNGLHNYRRLFHTKAVHLNFLSPEDQLYLVDHYMTYCQTAIHHQKTQSQNLAEYPGREAMGDFFFESVLDYMQCMTDSWKVELTWLQWLRERVVAHMQQPDNQGRSSLQQHTSH